MNGPEHYTEAEEILRQVDAAEKAIAERGGIPSETTYERFATERADSVARAQVHATLALAAATALRPFSDYRPWTAAAGPR